MADSRTLDFVPTAHSVFQGVGLCFAPSYSNATWFKWAIGWFLTVVAPATGFIHGAMQVQGFLDWASSDCWGCNAWPNLSNPGPPWIPGHPPPGRLLFSKEAYIWRPACTSPNYSQDLPRTQENGGERWDLATRVPSLKPFLHPAHGLRLGDLDSGEARRGVLPNQTARQTAVQPRSVEDYSGFRGESLRVFFTTC